MEMTEQQSKKKEKMKIKRAKVIQYMVPFAVRLHTMPDKMLPYFVSSCQALYR
jgi:hypothetical protein